MYTEAAVQILTRKALLTTNWPEYQDTLTYFEIYLILVFGRLYCVFGKL